ncbi:MAG: LexA family protein [Candidatus Caccovivens sp.]
MGQNNIFGNNLQFIRKSRGLTGEQLAKQLNVTSASVSQWENGKTFPSTQTLMELCKILNVSLTDMYMEHILNTSTTIPKGTRRIKKARIPVLGSIACGQPSYADELLEFYVDAVDGISADFALWAKGDSMIDARIYDGDLVFIRQQNTVENGEIAAVLIDNEATLKRVYYDEKNATLTLVAANSRYAPFVYHGEELNDIKILGKAVAFQSIVR